MVKRLSDTEIIKKGLEINALFMDRQRKFTETQGHKKLWNYFIDIIQSEKVQSEIARLRSENNIPSKGFEPKNLPWHEAIPEDWYQLQGGYTKLKNLEECLKNMLNKNDLSNNWIWYLYSYLFYNKFFISITENQFDMVSVIDVGATSKKDGQDLLPVSILISPYASQRDILDFIKTSYTILIEPIQKKYRNPKNKIGKIRTRSGLIRQRDRFIYEHKTLPYSEIVSMVARKFPKEVSNSIDEGSVGKIISLENKRRTEV